MVRKTGNTGDTEADGFPDEAQAAGTIVAVATTPGLGALAMVRLSGDRALAIADAVFRGTLVPSRARDRSILFGEIATADGEPIDQVLLLVMRGPGSLTGEDVVEVCCHGGMLAPRLVLKRLVEAGARPAEPGEFTKRAFLNGKMDLAQAEAVEEIVRASSDKALRAAVRQVRGELSRELADLEEGLLASLALIEANIDFVEDDVAEVDAAALASSLEGTAERMGAMLRAHEGGRLVRDGLDVAIVGKPNVGKSSLFNRLLGKDRVIVSETPGTTRDMVDGLIGVDGVVLKVRDTAGLRDTGEGIEREAVRRTREAIGESDLLLVVVDVSSGLTQEDLMILEETSGSDRIVVGNKVDLAGEATGYASAAGSGDMAGGSPGAWAGGSGGPGIPLALGQACVAVSALTGSGLPGLVEMLAARARQRIGDLGYDIIVNERHAVHLRSALEGVRRGLESLSRSLPMDFIASDIRHTIDCLGEISGRRVASRVLDEIFSRFCIGK